MQKKIIFKPGDQVIYRATDDRGNFHDIEAVAVKMTPQRVRIRFLDGEESTVGLRKVRHAETPEIVNMPDAYEVIVSNIGSVYLGTNAATATQKFDSYMGNSQSGVGRAAGESVTMLRDWEIVREFVGKLELRNGWKADDERCACQGCGKPIEVSEPSTVIDGDHYHDRCGRREN